MLGDDKIIDPRENAWATILGLRQHYKDNYDYYHPWAVQIHRSFIEEDENMPLRSIARAIGVVSEQDQNFIKLIYNKGIEMNTYKEVMVKELIGLIALSNGFD